MFMFQPPSTMFSVPSSLFLACLPVSLSHTCLHAEYGPSLASPTTTASSCRTTFHFSTSQSPYQPGSQLALPRLTGNLPLHVTMWIRHLDSSPAYDHVDSSCDLALPGISSFGLVMWTRHLDSSNGRQTRDQPLSTPTQPTQIPTYHSMGELQKGPIRTSVQPSHLRNVC